ncbi:MAG: hypothetical protein JW973_12795 [Bacteroidales bacterium]|nr:hypothetical protein [Bacteroidales bacterium]
MKNRVIKHQWTSALLLSWIILLAGILFQACEENDSEGTPSISYIRLTDPAKSDSMLTGAYMGNVIAIIGENLGSVKQVWFNDQRAVIYSTFITGTTVITQVPTTVPEEVNDKLKMVFADGSELLYDFKVNIPAPVISSVKCEYVPDGDTLVLYGDYFFNPEVFFDGDQKANIFKVTKTQLDIEVPAGAEQGPVVVKTKFGKVTSSFIFRDSRGVILDFDTKLGAGWRPGNRQSTDPDGVSDNYLILTGSLASDWDWKDDYLEMDFWGQASGNPEGPLFTGDPNDMLFKFEANVVNPWSGGWMQLIFSPWNNAGNAVNSDDNIARGMWAPWMETGTYQSDGWITVEIPLSEFKYDHTMTASNLKIEYPDNCGSLTIFVWGQVPIPCDVKICIDNVRIVPK